MSINITNIPKDVFTFKVCSFLQDEELVTLQLVSTDFLNAIEDDNILRTRVDQLYISITAKRRNEEAAYRGIWARVADVSNRGWDIMPPPRPPEIDYIDAEEVD